MPRAKVVATFHVSSGSIKRWLQLRQTTGDVIPHAPSGRTAIITPARYSALVAQIQAHTDATLAQQMTFWQASHGVTVSRWAMSCARRAAGGTRTKSR